MLKRTIIVTAVLVANIGIAQVQATMIVILARPGLVVVAADSRFRVDGTTVTDEECKIRRGARTVFIASGAYPTNVLKEIWATGDRLVKGDRSAAQNRDAMIAMLSRMNFGLPRELVGRFAFLEMTSSGPVLHAATVTMGATVQATFKRESSGDAWYTKPGYYTAGNYEPDFIKGIQTGLVASRTLEDLTALATSTIKAQSRIDPTVGGAIDILVLDATGGRRWIDVKASCQGPALF